MDVSSPTVRELDESAPLLQRQPPLVEQNGNEDLLDWKKELWILVKLAMPMWVTNVMEYSITGTAVVVVGHLGAEESVRHFRLISRAY